MQKAMNRFWDWLFHPSIRWYHYPKGKAAWNRYPSPGSSIKTNTVQDYKMPYQYSDRNIRYKTPVRSLYQQSSAQYFADGPGTTVIDKLRAAGFLQIGSNTNQQIEEAKKKYLQKFGVPVEQRVYKNDYNLQIPEGTNRQSYRKWVQQSLKSQSQFKQTYQNPATNRRFTTQPEPIWMESLDMFSHPHFQQTRLQIDYRLDNHANENAKRGYIEIRKGEKAFWKALDNSNDIKNIQKVQRAIGDDNPTNFQLRNTRIELVKDEKGNVLDINAKTKSV